MTSIIIIFLLILISPITIHWYFNNHFCPLLSNTVYSNIAVFCSLHIWYRNRCASEIRAFPERFVPANFMEQWILAFTNRFDSWRYDFHYTRKARYRRIYRC